jgi:hypothetical protein
MRSSYFSTVRVFARASIVHGECMRFVRCNSTKAGRQWSTPLARQLGEAIAVCLDTLFRFMCTSNLNTDNWPDFPGGIHATMPHISQWRVLHTKAQRTRSVWPEGRLYNVTGDISNVWRTTWHLVCCGMDGPREKKQWHRAY